MLNSFHNIEMRHQTAVGLLVHKSGTAILVIDKPLLLIGGLDQELHHDS
jgi:hypothetical protein